jgi:hypothetical protein
VTAERSRQGCWLFRDLGGGHGGAARIAIFTHVFFDSTVSKWRSLNVSDDRCVVVVVVVVGTIREAFQERGGAVIAGGTSRSIDRSEVWLVLSHIARFRSLLAVVAAT